MFAYSIGENWANKFEIKFVKSILVILNSKIRKLYIYSVWFQ